MASLNIKISKICEDVLCTVAIQYVQLKQNWRRRSIPREIVDDDDGDADADAVRWMACLAMDNKKSLEEALKKAVDVCALPSSSVVHVFAGLLFLAACASHCASLSVIPFFVGTRL